MNIQSKDFELLPYPHWVTDTDKARAIDVVEHLIEVAQATGRTFDRSDAEIRQLDELYRAPWESGL